VLDHNDTNMETSTQLNALNDRCTAYKDGRKGDGYSTPRPMMAASVRNDPHHIMTDSGPLQC
jgi:hypothetical protein